MSGGVAARWRAGLGRGGALWSGVRTNLRYSNGWRLNFQRLFRRGAAEVDYVWDNRIRIACDCMRGEHFGVHEVFVQRCYAPHLDRCRFAGGRVSVVDVGANVGAFSLGLRARGLAIEAGIAVELNPDTAGRCRRNLDRNGLGAMAVVAGGVAGHDGWIDFVPAADALGDNIFSEAGPAPAGGVAARRVELFTLATLLERHAGGRREFDLLKLDCEGAEYGILRTSPAEVLRGFRHVIVEFHAAPAGESLAAAHARLGRIGFARAEEFPARVPFVALYTRVSTGESSEANAAAS